MGGAERRRPALRRRWRWRRRGWRGSRSRWRGCGRRSWRRGGMGSRCWAGSRGRRGGRGRGRRRGNRGHAWHWYGGGSQGLDRHDKEALAPVLGVVGRAGITGRGGTARVGRPHEESLAPVSRPFGIAFEIGPIAVGFEVAVELGGTGCCARRV